MRREVLSRMTLSDGTSLAPGTFLTVSCDGHRSPTVYSSPDGGSDPSQFDGYRFHRLRSVPGNENTAQFVSTSPYHLGFGHGNHACPGRFFAANEVKIAMCYLLRRYDWKLAEGQAEPKVIPFGMSQISDPNAKVSLRRRA